MPKFELNHFRTPLPKADAIAGSMPAQMWVTNEIRDFAHFWPRSDRLGNAICYAFQCADIIELHCETFVTARNGRPWFVAIVNAADEPLALFPFMIERKRHIRILKFMDGALSDYNAPILFPPAKAWTAETIHGIWLAIQGWLPFDLATLEKVPEYIGQIKNPMTFLPMAPQGSSCHFRRFSGTWEEVSKGLPRRKELDRKSRRLNRRGRIAFEIAETQEQYDLLLRTLIRQKKQRDLEAHGGNDTLAIPGFLSYLIEARRLTYPSGPVALFALKVEDTIVATHWGYLVADRFYSLIPGFEGGDWYEYSPGFVLANKILEWCLANGVKIFDYGWGDEPYKREFCDMSISLFRAEIPATVRGTLYLKARGMKRLLAKMRV